VLTCSESVRETGRRRPEYCMHGIGGIQSSKCDSTELTAQRQRTGTIKQVCVCRAGEVARSRPGECMHGIGGMLWCAFKCTVICACFACTGVG